MFDVPRQQLFKCLNRTVTDPTATQLVEVRIILWRVRRLEPDYITCLVSQPRQSSRGRKLTHLHLYQGQRIKNREVKEEK
jgi:hypothetical protein